MRAALFLAVAATVSGLPSLAHAAETCPEIPETEAGLRRSMAKEWFAKAEEAEAGGDRAAAVKRYSCSLNLTPHPSTAYNLGTVAEKSGDWSMAIEGFRAYLKLAPEAADRPTIEARVAALEAKLAELRKDLTPKESPGTPSAAPVPAATAPTGAPPTLVSPPGGVPTEAPRSHVGGWVSLGGAVAAAGGAVALNLMARSKTDECHRLWARDKNDAALDRCDQAKRYAYTSYGLFGAAGVLGALGVTLLVWRSGSSESGPSGQPQPADTSDVAFVPLTGGGAAILTRRF
jgi:tetratricopeptide (TPR) repeat protein